MTTKTCIYDWQLSGRVEITFQKKLVHKNVFYWKPEKFFRKTPFCLTCHFSSETTTTVWKPSPISVNAKQQNTVFLVVMLILCVGAIFVCFAMVAICYRWRQMTSQIADDNKQTLLLIGAFCFLFFVLFCFVYFLRRSMCPTWLHEGWQIWLKSEMRKKLIIKDFELFLITCLSNFVIVILYSSMEHNIDKLVFHDVPWPFITIHFLLRWQR